MRLPPPARRYSPISVMAVTFDTVSRPNSASSRTRSSRSRSKISLPLMADVVLKRRSDFPNTIFNRRDRRARRGDLSPVSSCLMFFSAASAISAVPTLLVRTVVRKLHVDSEILPLDQGDDLLQRIAVLAAHAHHVALNRRLHFLLRILDQLHDVAGLLDRNALLHGDLLLGRAARGRFDGAVSQALQRYAALDQ